jgi:hypothetical protein
VDVNERDEQAARVALRILADRPSDVDLRIPTDLAERVERRYRRRRLVQAGVSAVVVMAVLGLVAVAAPRGRPAPVAGSSPSSSSPLVPGASGGPEGRMPIQDARYTDTVNLPGVTVAPPPAGAPLMSEARAVALYRSNVDGHGPWYVSHVSVGFATVTVDEPLRSGTAAWFVNRAAWVVVYSNPIPVCPQGPSFQDAWEVYLLDPASGRRAVVVGPACSGGDVAVTQAVSQVSEPWTVLRQDASGVTYRFTAGECRTKVENYVRGISLLGFIAQYTMDGQPCPYTSVSDVTIPGRIRSQRLTEGPVAEIVTTGTDGFVYDR